MTPPLPAHPWRLAPIWDEDEQKAMTEYGKACAAAEQDRIMRIVHEQANAYGKPGECMAIGIRAKVRSKPETEIPASETKTDWSAA